MILIDLIGSIKKLDSVIMYRIEKANQNGITFAPKAMLRKLLYLRFLSFQVMNNQEAVDIAKGIKDPQAAAKRLTTEALARKSKDDISCVVIRFG